MSLKKKIAIIWGSLISLLLIGLIIYLVPNISIGQDESYDDFITIDGKRYREKNITNYLIVGIDSSDEITESDSYNNLTQADYIGILSVDYIDSKYYVFNINRDTMCDVDILGFDGNVTGHTDKMQIALSHTYGDGTVSSSLNVARAVSRLLYGISIDYYITMSMPAVSIINDAIGGVNVTLDNDYLDLDESWTKGKTINLKGDEALKFIRNRYHVEDSTNIARMNRQRLYVESLINMIRESDEDTANYVDLYKDMENKNGYILTDGSINSFKGLVDDIKTYKFEGITSIAGYADYSSTYVEFYHFEEVLKEYVIEHYFNEV